MKPLLHHEIRGNWATVQLPINPDDSIDLARLADAVERIFAFGVDGLYTNGTAGEFHTQREAEFDAVHDCVAQRCERANTPFQIGVSHMSAQISLDRLKRSVQYAPSAFQVILPDWVVPREDEAVDFLNRMAEAAEGIGLVLYNPPHAKRQLSPIELGRLKQRVPRLVGVKVAGGEADWYRGMREHMQGLSVFVPGHHLANGIREGAHGSYSNVCCIHPGAAQAWYDSMSESMEHAMDVERRLWRVHGTPYHAVCPPRVLQRGARQVAGSNRWVGGNRHDVSVGRIGSSIPSTPNDSGAPFVSRYRNSDASSGGITRSPPTLTHTMPSGRDLHECRTGAHTDETWHVSVEPSMTSPDAHTLRCPYRLE